MTNQVNGTDNTINQMRVVTISREYGSGGGELAARLAQRFGWKLIDHEVIVQVASALGVSEADAEAHDEHLDNVVLRAISSLGVLQAAAPMAMPGSFMPESDVYDEARRRVIMAAVEQGHVVIVGRGAQMLLGERRDTLNVRVVAPLEQRIDYVMRREGLNRAAAQSRIQHKERDRVRFLMAQHHRSPEDVHLYDLVVSTGVIDLDSVVDLLLLALERKAGQLSTPAEELGPGAGLSRYPTPPGNFDMAATGNTIDSGGQ